VPDWYARSGLGIFVHWTPASVPGWAPVGTDVGELFAGGRPDAMSEIPYAEWYENSLRFPGSSVSRHHRATHGTKPYREFAGEWVDALDGWDPDDWARRFRAAGAAYVVLVTKHLDGYCLWPTAVANPNRADWSSGRDVVGEFRDAVLGAGMRFGVYYCGGLDFTFDDRPLGNLGDVVAALPRGRYPAYAAAQVQELVARYRPSLVWNDVAWPQPGRRLWPLFEQYYDIVPDGVVNDRWMPWSPAMGLARFGAVRRRVDRFNTTSARESRGVLPPEPPHYDFRTPEYTVAGRTFGGPWECVRGMDRSFGYNRNSGAGDFIGRDELLGLLGDVNQAGGNLLLNVGPRGEDATIPAEQVRRLDWLAARPT
jgi:alpha-L-fucosidase